MILRLLFVLIPEFSMACAVCGYGQDGAQAAFFNTTWLLTFIPLGMGGGIIYYLYRRSKIISPIISPAISPSKPNHPQD